MPVLGCSNCFLIALGFCFFPFLLGFLTSGVRFLVGICLRDHLRWQPDLYKRSWNSQLQKTPCEGWEFWAFLNIPFSNYRQVVPCLLVFLVFHHYQLFMMNSKIRLAGSDYLTQSRVCVECQSVPFRPFPFSSPLLQARMASWGGQMEIGRASCRERV